MARKIRERKHRRRWNRVKGVPRIAFAAPNGMYKIKRALNANQLNVATYNASPAGSSISNTTPVTILIVGGVGSNYFTFAYAFTVADLLSVNDLKIWDQYRLRKVQLEIIPFTTCSNSTQITGGTTSNGVGGCFHLVTDYDDATAPASSTAGISTLQCYKGYRSYNLTDTRKIKRTISPKLAIAAYGGAFTTYANTGNKQWLDVNNYNVQYYGVKGIFEVFQNAITASATVMAFKTNLLYTIEVKNPVS